MQWIGTRAQCCAITSTEPRCEKTGLRGFRPGPTQPGCTAIEEG